MQEPVCALQLERNLADGNHRHFNIQRTNTSLMEHNVIVGAVMGSRSVCK
jgi:hypothetical protein